MSLPASSRNCRSCGELLVGQERRRVKFTVDASEHGWHLLFPGETAYFCVECAPTQQQIRDFAVSFIDGIKAQQAQADDALRIPGLPDLVYKLYNHFGTEGFTRLQGRDAGILPPDSRQHTGLSELLKQEWLRAEKIEGTNVHRYFIGERALILLGQNLV